MTMRAPVSVCMITAGEPTLEDALRSVAPWVAHVAILACVPPDPIFERAKRALGPDGPALSVQHRPWRKDFSYARTESFRMAVEPWILWLDSDDVLRGGEHLFELVTDLLAKHDPDTLPRVRVVLPYEYASESTPLGRRVSVVQQRERLVRREAKWSWVHPVHETLMIAAPATADGVVQIDEPCTRIVVEHRRPGGLANRTASERNLEILLSYADTARPDEAWLHLNLGLELQNLGRYAEAEEALRRYLALSQWPEERLFAHLRRIDCLLALHMFDPRSDKDIYELAPQIGACQEVNREHPGRFEAMFASARVMFAWATLHNETATYKFVIDTLRRALDTPIVSTPMATRPFDRIHAAPDMLRTCCEALCDWKGCLDAVDRALVHQPDDPALRLHRRRYEALASVEARPVPVPKQTEHRPDRYDIVFACGETAEPWNPVLSAKVGIGGSETAVMAVAQRLAARGHRVRVYTNCGEEGLYGDVEYYRSVGLEWLEKCDMLVGWRNLEWLQSVRARAKWCWVHDTFAKGDTSPYYRSLADRSLALSQWHAQHLTQDRGFEWERVSVTRNGIDLDRFVSGAGPRPPRAIYSSSPDRGLEPLLAVWPRIRAAVPDAELDVFYGLEGLRGSGERGHAWAGRIAATAEKLADSGVRMRGRVSQAELAKEMLGARVWVHPAWHDEKPWPETSCISAMEAQAAGLHVVTRRYAALAETILPQASVWWLDGDPWDPSSATQLVGAVAAALRSTRPVDRQIAAAMDAFGWEAVIDQWDEWIREDMAKAPAVPTEAPAPPAVELVRPERLVLDMALGPHASGHVVMDPATAGLEATGGGCRAGFHGLVRAMARHHTPQYAVRAFSTYATPQPTTIDGVEYHRLDDLRTKSRSDALLAYYDTGPLIGQSREKAGLTIASHHTYLVFDHAWDFTDVNTAPSQHTVDVLRKIRSDSDRRTPWWVLPNAVEGLDQVERAPVAGRVLYHTSPDRGLHRLLAAWPMIRAHVADATLHVVGDVNATIYGAGTDRGIRAARAELLRNARDTALAAGGVTFLGRVPRADLLRELSEASCFAFPASVAAACETFSISILECLTLGIPVVLAPVDALGELWADGALLVEQPRNPAGEAMFLRRFARAVSDVLVDTELAASLSQSGHQVARGYSFRRTAETLHGILQIELRRVAA